MNRSTVYYVRADFPEHGGGSIPAALGEMFKHSAWSQIPMPADMGIWYQVTIGGFDTLAEAEECWRAYASVGAYIDY